MTNAKLCLQAQDLSVSLSLLPEGLACTGLSDLKTQTTLFAGNASLFSLQVKTLSTGCTETLDSLSGWTVSASADAAQFVFTRPELRVFLTASRPGNSAIEWTVSYAVSAPDVSVQSMTYPVLHITISSDDDGLFFPQGCGTVTQNLLGVKQERNDMYPSINASCPYMACYHIQARRGIYYGAHDRLAAAKRIAYTVEPNGTASDLLFSIDVPAMDLTHPQNSQTLNGRLVWALFDGDWYDAAQIYRAFVLAEADWLPSFGRPDVPRWMRETPLWFSGGVENVLKASEEIGVPAALHLYCWHKIPFDNDYPHYFPARDTAAAEIAALQERGIHVMPYINGRLWDTRDRGTEDWLFSALAKPGAAKNADGQVITESYGSKETDGSDVKLAVMCPQSSVWNDTVRDICSRILTELNADAVYIDQIAAAPPVLCCDPAHNHPSGGGHWWVEAYNRMLDAIQRTAAIGKTLATECTGEPYMRHLSGMLSWDWIHDGQVPALPAIYAGYVTYIGRNYGADMTPEGTRILAAQSFLSGEAMGWLSADYYLNLAPEDRAFLRSLIQMRYRFNDFLINGRMLRPPFITCSLPDVKTPNLTERPVLSAIWERQPDGARLLLVVNLSPEPADVTLRSDDLTALPEDMPDAAFENSALRLHLAPLSAAAAVVRK